MNATTNNLRSGISAKTTRCLWLRQESFGKMTAGQVLADYIEGKKHVPKTTKIFYALPLYDQHTAVCVCPSSSCETVASYEDLLLYM